MLEKPWQCILKKGYARSLGLPLRHIKSALGTIKHGGESGRLSARGAHIGGGDNGSNNSTNPPCITLFKF